MLPGVWDQRLSLRNATATVKLHQLGLLLGLRGVPGEVVMQDAVSVEPGKDSESVRPANAKFILKEEEIGEFVKARV